MKQDSDSRRAFLQKFGAIAASVTIVPIAAGCGGGGSSEGTATGGGGTAAAKLDCSDLSGLTEQDNTLRSTLSYVEVSPEAEKFCDNCQFYTIVEGNADCGGCTILKGPIAAKGYCTSWAAMPA